MIIRKISFLLFTITFLGSFNNNANAQVTTYPLLPTENNPVVITLDATGTGLEGYTGDVFTHTGVTIDGDKRWQYVIGDWGNNDEQPQLNRLDTDLYELHITPSIRDYYDVPESETITEMSFVFRSADASLQTSPDIFITVFQEGLIVSIISPPKNMPIVEYETNLEIHVASASSEALTLYINDDEITSTDGDEIIYDFYADSYGSFWIKAVATSGTDEMLDSTYIFVRPDPIVAELPEGMISGPNYIDDNTVTLVLHDPPALKEYVFAISGLTDWLPNEDCYMKRTPDGKFYWITFEGLTPNEEYGYQYFIDNELRIPDPYTHKVLDPWMDKWIDDFNYPNLKPYPEHKTTGYVSIMHPGAPAYEWEITDFTPPDVQDMIIYELLIRDFVETSAIKTVMDSLDYLQNLGVNVIELLPINQFEGNISWGYNPAMYFAPDKAYGTMNDYKRFIDECHKRGIAVVIDIVLNHSFNLSPMVQMYFDPQAGSYGKPLPENPWYLVDCPHEPWCWGNTFDQESPYSIEFFDRVLEYWLTEFKVDGFRFDFTKGFTNVQTANQGWNYDANRIANLKRIYDHIKDINPDAYVILEHFTENSEEKELAEYGMLIWGNMSYTYRQAAMSWLNNSNFSWISHKNRDWDVPHLIGYMESHDEERIMYDNLNYGNSSNPNHDIKNLDIALSRAELVAALFIPIPGPKMIWQFGELGYDYSINHCPDGTIDDGCRTDPKPIRWDYFDNELRRRVYYVYSALAKIKTSYDIFRTDDFELNVAGETKRLHLNLNGEHVNVMGNFGVEGNLVNPFFQRTGIWYEYFTGEEVEVTNIHEGIYLRPGEYRLYSTIEFPPHGYPINYQIIDYNSEGLTVYPNPSKDHFYFDIYTDEGGSFTAEIYNLLGQRLFSEKTTIPAGSSRWMWDSKNSNGEKASEGVYFYKIRINKNVFTGKLLLH